jgi:hypothetical protein
MKTLITIATMMVLTVAVAAAAPSGSWLDLENCAMCKNLTDDQELFANMTWDTRLFANGLVEVTTVPAHFEERFEKLTAKMQDTSAKMMGGEQLPMCGMCMSYGNLMMAGVSMDQMTVDDARISVISSRDPEVVEKIRTHGQKTIDEYAKWMATEKDDDHGQGHGHNHHH